MSKKYFEIMLHMGDFDWTNINNELKPFPIMTLQPITLQFLIASQYFTDKAQMNECLERIQLILEKQSQKKNHYDVHDDIAIQEMRQLNLENIDEIQQIYEFELEKVKQSNKDALDKLKDCNVERLDIIPQYELLKDIAGLTKEEILYIETIQTTLQMQTEQGKTNRVLKTQQIVDDALCQVCNDGDYQEDNLIVFCAKCNISVHQKCYLIDEIPMDDWICDVCLNFGWNGQYLRCALCPRLGGAMKQTNQLHQIFQNYNPEYYKASQNKQELIIQDDYYDFIKIPNRDIRDLADVQEPSTNFVWVHLSCFYWVPECYLDEKNNQLKGLENINPKRFTLECDICKLKKSGVCVQCTKLQCQKSFHVECARRSNIFLTINLSSSKLDYQLYCQPHIPLKVKRQLDSKYKQYEKDIVEFFRSYEKAKSSYYKPQKKIKQQVFEGGENKELIFIEFAEQFKMFLDKVLKQSVVLNGHKQDNLYFIEDAKFIEPSKNYELKIQTTSYYKQDKIKKIILPYYKSCITSTDQIWNHFKFKDYDRELIFSIYEKIRRRAARVMQEINPNKKQTKLTVIKKEKKNQKLKLKQETQIQNTIDDKIYCICRLQDDQTPMIFCDNCQEWYHFKCLGLKLSKQDASENLQQFYCFLCYDELPKEKKLPLKKQYKNAFVDYKFKMQRQIAIQCNLSQIRDERLHPPIQFKVTIPFIDEIEIPKEIKTPSKTESVEEQDNQQKQVKQEKKITDFFKKKE
ncbi:hypothetical protein pb186bvf_010662 [Paramecium bursaria]